MDINVFVFVARPPSISTLENSLAVQGQAASKQSDLEEIVVEEYTNKKTILGHIDQCEESISNIQF